MSEAFHTQSTTPLTTSLQQFYVTLVAGAGPQQRTTQVRHEEQCAGREGPSAFPSFQYLNDVCDWSSLENRGVDPNEGSIHFAHM